MRFALLALALTACSGSRPVTCTPEARDALGVFYEQLASAVVDGGACDTFARVEECPAYVVLETHYLAARKGICP